MDDKRRILSTVSIYHAFNDGSVVLIPILFPILKSLFNLSYTEIGIITGGGLLITLISQLIIGTVSDKKNRVYILTMGMVLISATCLVFPLANGFITLLLLMFLLRFSTSFFHPVGIAWVSKLFKKDNLDWAMGIQSAMGDFGAFVVILTIPFIAEIKNWTYTLYLWSIIGVICLFVSIFLIKNLKEEHFINSNNNNKKQKFRKTVFEDWSTIEKTKLLLPAFIISGLAWGVIINYLPLLLAERTNLSIAFIGLFVSIWIGIGTVECLFYSRIISKFGRKKVIIISYITLGFASILLSFFTNLFLLLIIIIILGLSTFLTYPALFSFVSELTDENIGGKTFGIIFTLELAGGTIILFLSGLASDIWGIWTPFMILGVLSLISIVPLLKIIVKTPSF